MELDSLCRSSNPDSIHCTISLTDLQTGANYSHLCCQTNLIHLTGWKSVHFGKIKTLYFAMLTSAPVNKDPRPRKLLPPNTVKLAPVKVSSSSHWNNAWVFPKCFSKNIEEKIIPTCNLLRFWCFFDNFSLLVCFVWFCIDFWKGLMHLCLKVWNSNSNGSLKGKVPCWNKLNYLIFVY